MASIAELRRYAAARSEALVFWGGAVCGEHLQVTGLYMLGHDAQGSRVAVTRDETRWLLRELRRRDEKLIAQFHSHPVEAYHSGGDDAHAAAFHDGLLSIVAPRYALDVELPTDCAVYVYRNGHFEQAQIAATLHVEPWIVRRRVKSIASLPVQADPSSEKVKWTATLVSKLRKKLTGLRRR